MNIAYNLSKQSRHTKVHKKAHRAKQMSTVYAKTHSSSHKLASFKNRHFKKKHLSAVSAQIGADTCKTTLDSTLDFLLEYFLAKLLQKQLKIFAGMDLNH